jgi:hypothetical protein
LGALGPENIRSLFVSLSENHDTDPVAAHVLIHDGFPHNVSASSIPPLAFGYFDVMSICRLVSSRPLSAPNIAKDNSHSGEVPPLFEFRDRL